jgi:hypothetical protein
MTDDPVVLVGTTVRALLSIPRLQVAVDDTYTNNWQLPGSKLHIDEQIPIELIPVFWR